MKTLAPNLTVGSEPSLAGGIKGDIAPVPSSQCLFSPLVLDSLLAKHVAHWKTA